MKVAVNSERIDRELEELGLFSDTPFPSVTRIVFSDNDLRARSWLKNLLFESGLAVREDAVGNTFARWEGAEPGLPAIATGSHIDAIPNAGRFDGTVGVLGGLEAIRALKASGFQPNRSIELIFFTSEEPTRFGLGCLGSRLLSGTLDSKTADQMRDEGGTTLEALRQHAGFTGDLSQVVLPAGHYLGFIELHIEQGTILEREALPAGLVTHIAAPASLRFLISGEGGHAGAMLMRQRHDAFLAAAELALAVESAALQTGSADTVATTGVCLVFPGAVNSVPSRVQLMADIRDIDGERRDQVLEGIERAAAQIASKRGVAIASETLNADGPAACDAGIIEALEQGCQALGYRCLKMVSRAYHDSLFMSRICPVSMLFIPCRKGVSHRPDEFVSLADITKGIEVLAGTLAKLAQ